MKPKYTMALAVLAVVLMLGSALVPLGFNNDNDAESAVVLSNTTEKEAVSDYTYSPAVASSSSSASIADIYTFLRTMSAVTDGITGSVSYDDEILVPVDNDTNYSVMEMWDGKTVSGNKVVGLYEGVEVNVESTVYIEKGSTFVLFPTAAKNNISFTLNGVTSTSCVYLMSGSYLDIFGFKFSVVGAEDNDRVNLLEVKNKVKVESALANSQIATTVELGANSEFEVFNIEKFVNTTDKAQTSSDAAITMTAKDITANKNKFEAKEISLKIKSEIYSSDYDKVILEETTTMDSLKVTFEDKKLVVEFGEENSDLTYSTVTGETETVVLEATKIYSPAGKMTLSLSATPVTVGESKELSLDMALSVSMNDSKSEATISSVKYTDMVKISGMKSTFNSMDVSIKADAANKTSTIAVKINGEATISIDEIIADVSLTSMSGLGDSAKSQVSVKGFSASVKDLDVTYACTSTTDDVTAKIGEMKLAVEELTYKADSKATKADATGSLSFSVKDTSVTYKGTSSTNAIATDASSEVKASVGSIELSITVSVPAYYPYAVTVSIEGSDISVDYKDYINVSVGKAKAKIVTKYDGIDRAIEVEIKAFSYITEEQTVKEEKKTVTKVKAESIEASCNVPFAKMIPSSLGVPIPNIDVVIEGKNVYYETGGEKNVTTADYIKIEGGCSIFSSSAPYFESMMIEGEQLSYDYENNNLLADSISGYLKNYGESKENFKIEKKGDDKVTLSYDSAKYSIVIVKGAAEFSAGLIPSNITVGKDASFKADGVSAPQFYFEEGATLSGTVSLNSAEVVMYNDAQREIVYGNVTLITMKPVSGDSLNNAGYNLTYDIGTRTSGTLTACTGYSIPDWKAEYGQQWTKAEDGKTATFTVPETGATFAFQADANSYNLTIEDGTPVTKKYNDQILLAEVPAKIGFKALGWSDGSEEIFYAGDYYTMPARDVVLKAVYADNAPTEEVNDKEVSVKSDKASSVIVTKETIAKVVEGGSLIIKVDGGEVKMDKSTIDSLKSEAGTDDLNLMLSITKADEINDDVKQKIIGSGTLYNIKLVTDDGKTFDYDESETFEVSLNVKVSGKVDHFKITYLGDNYETHEVGVSGFSQSGDNDCTVTFDCNHFSDYVIEPVYKSTNWGLIIAIIVIAVLVVAAIIYLVVRSKSQTKAI